MPFGMTLLHDLIASGCCWLAQPTNPSAAIKKTEKVACIPFKMQILKEPSLYVLQIP
jgi:hypothetical protein